MLEIRLEVSILKSFFDSVADPDPDRRCHNNTDPHGSKSWSDFAVTKKLDFDMKNIGTSLYVGNMS